jgi:uncharacterized protein (DUF302 family)
MMETDVIPALRLPAALFASAFAAILATGLSAGPAAAQDAQSTPMAVSAADGVVQLQSRHGFDDTVARVQAAVAAKGVKFFDAIDQTKLGADANLKIGRSTLVLFGNPPLGVQFLQSNPYAGLDWPVRMLVTEDANGGVWLAWTNFNYIADRYRIADKPAQIKMAGEVAAAIAADAAH